MGKTIRGLMEENERLQLLVYRWQKDYRKLRQQNKELLKEITDILTEKERENAK